MWSYHWSMDVPKRSLLAIEYLTFLSVPFLIHSEIRPPTIKSTRAGARLLILSFRLHENEFPLPAEHFLQLGQILRLEVLQLQMRLVLHRSLA